jgi:hypothetical protein
LLQQECQERCNKDLLGFYFIMWLGLYCPILCELSFPICDSVLCDNRVTFQVVSYVPFLCFLSGSTELVGVTYLPMLQRQKYVQSFVMFLLFANVAE